MKWPPDITWKDIFRTVLAVGAIAVAIAVLVLAGLAVKGTADQSARNERLQRRIDQQNAQLEVQRELLGYMEAVGRHQECGDEVQSRYDLAYGDLILYAASLPDGQSVTPDHPTVIAYGRATEDVRNISTVCPVPDPPKEN